MSQHEGSDYLYRYKYDDMDCGYCLYSKKCEFDICPYIVEFIDDLKKDRTFHEAVANAESCGNRHRQTLIMLKGEFEHD